VLNGATFSIEAGKVTALVGESGQRQEHAHVTAACASNRRAVGRYLIDGVDVTQRSISSVRGQFALVTQEALLFSASVRATCSWADPGDGAGTRRRVPHRLRRGTSFSRCRRASRHRSVSAA
jgi:subfamily B ATP-binding cassette protein MsbA